MFEFVPKDQKKKKSTEAHLSCTDDTKKIHHPREKISHTKLYQAYSSKFNIPLSKYTKSSEF